MAFNFFCGKASAATAATTTINTKTVTSEWCSWWEIPLVFSLPSFGKSHRKIKKSLGFNFLSLSVCDVIGAAAVNSGSFSYLKSCAPRQAGRAPLINERKSCLSVNSWRAIEGGGEDLLKDRTCSTAVLIQSNLSLCKLSTSPFNHFKQIFKSITAVERCSCLTLSFLWFEYPDSAVLFTPKGRTIVLELLFARIKVSPSLFKKFVGAAALNEWSSKSLMRCFYYIFVLFCRRRVSTPDMGSPQVK